MISTSFRLEITAWPGCVRPGAGGTGMNRFPPGTLLQSRIVSTLTRTMGPKASEPTLKPAGGSAACNIAGDAGSRAVRMGVRVGFMVL